ncbi:MAG: transporter permease [Chloroflexi bacterium]|jgi:D-methionine transport system permease protein|nr:transporter permease [Chloroflexota bacterium]
MNWEMFLPQLWASTLETFYMVGFSTLLTLLLGLPLGLLLVLTGRGNLMPQPIVNSVLGWIVNIGRSLPFIILLVAITPLTRLIAGTTIGATAAIVPLTLAAVPFFARVAETALQEVDRGLVEATQSMGCSTWQIVSKVYIPESLPALVRGITITIISLIGFSAMAGAVGSGGLGDLAIRYGYQRFETDIMVVTVVLLIVLVQLVQFIGNFTARRLSHR